MDVHVINSYYIVNFFFLYNSFVYKVEDKKILFFFYIHNVLVFINIV